MARIIFLHGATSSGKTTLARALQARLDAPFWHVSLDHLRDGGVLPMARFRQGGFNWARHRDRVFAGLHGIVAAAADSGNDLIFEHILDCDAWALDLQQRLSAHDVFFVALHCDADELARREALRGDRPLGSAIKDRATIHAGRAYDLELRSEEDVEVNADRVMTSWMARKGRSHFFDFDA